MVLVIEAEEEEEGRRVSTRGEGGLGLLHPLTSSTTPVLKSALQLLLPAPLTSTSSGG